MFEREKVFHKVYGEGTVLSCDKNEIIVDFSFETKKMSLKSMMEKGFFRFENRSIQAEFDPITAIIEKKNNNGEEKGLIDGVEDERPIDMTDREAKRDLLDILKRYGFEGFLHTTEFENFHSIIKSGYLIPRDDLEKRNVSFCDSANRDVLAFTNEIVKQCCRFYYYYKTPTNFRAGYQHPVIIVYHDDLLFDDNSYFTQYNAAKFFNGMTDNPKEALSFNWQGIFERGSYTNSKFYREGGDSDHNNKDYINGIRNAEFLVYGRVDIAYIKKVYFKYQQDLEKAKLFCPKAMLNKLACDKGKFD